MLVIIRLVAEKPTKVKTLVLSKPRIVKFADASSKEVGGGERDDALPKN